MFVQNRKFVIFQYSIGHGRLVFRSGPSPSFSTRIDVVFVDVRAIDCRTDFESLTIKSVCPSSVASTNKKHLQLSESEPGLKLFAICDGNWKGHIVAADYFVFEDQGKFFDDFEYSPKGKQNDQP